VVYLYFERLQQWIADRRKVAAVPAVASGAD
jgi:hypothetical protein